MGNETSKTKNSFLYILNHMTLKDKIIWVLQVIFPAAILVVAILGLNNVFPIRTTNMIDLVLLMLMFIICGIKLLPERMVYAVIYFVLSALMCGILIASFFI